MLGFIGIGWVKGGYRNNINGFISIYFYADIVQNKSTSLEKFNLPSLKVL